MPDVLLIVFPNDQNKEFLVTSTAFYNEWLKKNSILNLKNKNVANTPNKNPLYMGISGFVAANVR